MKKLHPCVYILGTRRNGTLYVGVTSQLARRINLHREEVSDGFTKKYGVRRLVWLEWHATMIDAIRREKAIKRWNRGWKIQLIENVNPYWRDLFDEICGQ